MDLMWIAEGVGLVLLSLSSGAAGYFWRDSQDPDTIVERERVRIERVEVPRIVEKEVVRVERIEVPVVVEKPTIKVECVEVPHLIEKTVVKTETVAAPAIAGLRIGKPKGTPVKIKLASNSGRIIGEHEIEDTKRTPNLQVELEGALCNFMASHQEADGQWVYRRVNVERR